MAYGTPITTPVGRFKTAHNQKQLVFNADVVCSATQQVGGVTLNNVNLLPVGTPVQLTQAPTAANGYCAVFTPVAATVDPTLANLFIIAQSDATISAGHVPVETLSFRYIQDQEFVAGTVLTAPTASVNGSPTAKVVTVFRVTDPTDVVFSVR